MSVSQQRKQVAQGATQALGQGTYATTTFPLICLPSYLHTVSF